MLVAEPVPDRDAVRNPATVIAEPYEPASRREVTAGETVAAELWEYRENATFGTLREQTSALATQFGRSGGLDRDPWWNAEIQQSILGRAGTTLSIGLDEIYRRTLSHSNQVRVLAGIPLIRETAIDEAEGRFAVEAFSESRYDRRNEPSGSSIVRNDPGDLSRDRNWIFRGGIRKQTYTGAEVSLGQELSQESSNAEYFIPREQGRAGRPCRSSNPSSGGRERPTTGR